MSQHPSPCTKDCKIDSASGLCRGCLRTMEEIVSWGGANEAEKRRTLASVAERLAARGTQKGAVTTVRQNQEMP